MTGTGDGEIWQSCFASPVTVGVRLKNAANFVDRQGNLRPTSRSPIGAVSKSCYNQIKQIFARGVLALQQDVESERFDKYSTLGLTMMGKRQGRTVGY